MEKVPIRGHSEQHRATVRNGSRNYTYAIYFVGLQYDVEKCYTTAWALGTPITRRSQSDIAEAPEEPT